MQCNIGTGCWRLKKSQRPTSLPYWLGLTPSRRIHSALTKIASGFALDMHGEALYQLFRLKGAGCAAGLASPILLGIVIPALGHLLDVVCFPYFRSQTLYRCRR
jgi:hypothetical protein